jgi:hypothetical protein
MRPRFTKQEAQEIDEALADPYKVVFTHIPRQPDCEKWYFVIGKTDNNRLLALYCADDFGVMFLRDATTEEQFTYHYAPPRLHAAPKIR